MHAAQLTQSLAGMPHTCCVPDHFVAKPAGGQQHGTTSRQRERSKPGAAAASMGVRAAAGLNSRLEVLRPQVLVQPRHAQTRQELVLKDEP